MKKMNELKINSLLGHLAVVVVAFIISVLVWQLTPLNIWLSLMISYSAVFSVALLIFLIFSVPLIRGRLKKTSWRYRWLKYAQERDLDEINVCHLPGIILNASFFSIISVMFALLALLALFFNIMLGNILYPIFCGEYFSLDKEYFPVKRKIPWLPEKRIGGPNGIILRPWMPIAVGITLWGVWKLAVKINFDSVAATISVIIAPYIAYIVYGIGIISFVIFVIWLFVKWQIWTFIKTFIIKTNEKFCIVGKVLDE